MQIWPILMLISSRGMKTEYFNEDLDSIFAQSDTIYAGIVREYPFLDAPARTPKRMAASELMSRINFTGVVLPLFTSETNLNDQAPSMLIPSTIAHELAHQREIAPEQEANFVAGPCLPDQRQ